MEDKQLRILVLTKLYEYGRTHYSVREFEKDAVFQGVDLNQLNFAFQYLGTQNLIQYSLGGGNGLFKFTPEFITGKGIDIVESLISKITDKIKNKALENASSVIDKIAIFLAESLTNEVLWDAVIQIFDELIKKLQFIF